jgi:hypothetical protein
VEAAVSLRDDRTGFIVVTVLALALTLPLWLARFPIAQDLPAHVETAAQILALWRGDDVVTRAYVLHALPWPNALPTLALAPLVAVVDGLVAAKLLVAVGVVLWPLALALLCTRLGRPALVAALALPTCFDLSFSYGFLHFVVGKPLWVLCVVWSIDAARAPTLRRFIAVVVALTALFCTHLLLFATALPLCVLCALVQAESTRARLVGVASVVAGALPGAAWWLLARPAETAGGAIAFLPLPQTLANLWSNAGELHDGVGDAIPWVLAGIALIVVVGLARGDPASPPRRRDTATLAVLVGGVAVFALAGPVRTPHVSIVAERFVGVACGLAPGLLLRTLTASAARAIVLAMTAAVSVAVVDVTVRWRAFSAEDMGDFDALLSRVPRGSRVATHYVTPFSPWGVHNAAWHWPKLVALSGSSTDDSFAWRSTCVVGRKAGVPLPRHPGLDRAALSSWDFLLVRGDSPAVDRALASLPLTLVTSTGTWRLFRVVAKNGDHVDEGVTGPATRNPALPSPGAPPAR